jgi:transcriptional regulator with XRE-family HTH domain
MARRDPETNPRAFLGAELRRARAAAGFSSQEALASKLGFDRSVVAKAETGERPPTPEVLSAWCLACQLDDDLFARIAKLARSADGPIPAWFETWLEAEREAHMLRIWQPLIIPGLLQTGEYARALFLAAGADEDQAEDMVKARLDRQEILDRPGPPDLVTVLDESVLHRLIGSPQVMADQLSYIAERATLPHILVQVVPAGNGANAGLSGGFALASCDGAPDTLRMEAVEDVTAEGRSLVRRAANILVRVQADALPRAASRTLILEAAEQWKTT